VSRKAGDTTRGVATSGTAWGTMNQRKKYSNLLWASISIDVEANQNGQTWVVLTVDFRGIICGCVITHKHIFSGIPCVHQDMFSLSVRITLGHETFNEVQNGLKWFYTATSKAPSILKILFFTFSWCLSIF
jgi:hypothetical protein